MADSLELLFIDAKSAGRLRRRPAWSSLLAEARQSGVRPESDAPPLPGQDIPAEDRGDLFVILARATPSDVAGVSLALSEAVRDDGKLAPPLVLVSGELSFAFDELSALKSTVTTATPFAGGDEALEAAVGAGQDFLASPALLAAPAVVEVLTTRLREAFRRTRRVVPADYLEAQSERALLDQRCYQKRLFQGAPHLRALLSLTEGGAKGSMLVYLPAALAPSLPLYQRFTARLVAEVHPPGDQLESHPFSLRTLALARVLPAAKR